MKKHRFIIWKSPASGLCCKYVFLCMGEMRVFPNRSVFGDAAGVTTAYCIGNAVCPCDVTSAQIETIQNMPRAEGAILL